MVSKSQIKFVKSLGQQKFRQKYDKFTAEGEKTGIEFLKHPIFSPISVYYTSISLESTLLSLDLNIEPELISSVEMAQMSTFKTPSSLLVVLEKKENICDLSQLNQEKSLYLDDIQDPGNLGTIIRIADWFGIKNIIRSPGSVDFFNPKAVQSSMGSLCNVRTASASLSKLIEKNPQISVFGAFMDGILIHELPTPMNPCGILIIGNEGQGIRKENIPLVTQKIAIAGQSQKIAESLNAAMACGIICHNWVYG
ncbi:MAG: RNA methyltransferase [Saprospiraceae bacterium]